MPLIPFLVAGPVLVVPGTVFTVPFKAPFIPLVTAPVSFIPSRPIFTLPVPDITPVGP
ncbi:hypothetical protein D3C81_2137070 [compost metagenome]